MNRCKTIWQWLVFASMVVAPMSQVAAIGAASVAGSKRGAWSPESEMARADQQNKGLCVQTQGAQAKMLYIKPVTKNGQTSFDLTEVNRRKNGQTTQVDTKPSRGFSCFARRALERIGYFCTRDGSSQGDDIVMITPSDDGFQVRWNNRSANDDEFAARDQGANYQCNLDKVIPAPEESTLSPEKAEENQVDFGASSPVKVAPSAQKATEKTEQPVEAPIKPVQIQPVYKPAPAPVKPAAPQRRKTEAAMVPPQPTEPLQGPTSSTEMLQELGRLLGYPDDYQVPNGPVEVDSRSMDQAPRGISTAPRNLPAESIGDTGVQ